VLPLSRALSLLYAGRLPPDSVAITFDDGWLGTYAVAVPALADQGYPATIYLTTRDVVAETPVFDVFLPYLLWAGRARQLDLHGLVPDAQERFDLRSPAQRERATAILGARVAEEGFARTDREELLSAVADRLGLDYQALLGTGICRLMTREQVARLRGTPIEPQLHTHSHSLSTSDETLVHEEIRQNRQVLQGLTDVALEHLCYPSGVYHPRTWPWLEGLGIVSAATCMPGLNYEDTPRYELRRFLDGANISQIEFEAELSGVLELLRRARSLLRRQQRPS
jgi:peptidoglycan/xylan/chitin deacetylase (PgdA/CDA1 family)